MSKIREAFRGKKAFIPFITAGDPDFSTTKALVVALERAGASVVELGIPFSDPTAEGPVIQGANLRALAGGATTDRIFDMVKELRQEVKIPLVFMTYANVVFSYGIERFAERMEEVGMDGLILPDVPFEEKEEFAPACRAHGIDWISLVAPTSEERIGMIAREAEGFLYLVSSLGVTGERREITSDLPHMLSLVREANPSLPCAIGFGISTPEQAGKMAKIADGVIVGSAIVRKIGEKKSVSEVEAFVRSMVDALSER